MALILKQATRADVATIHELTVALALYERKTPDQILVTPEKLAKWGFGKNKIFEVVIARLDGVPVGMALYFYTYAGSVGAPILYIEDLFVLPEHRGHGIGTALLKHLAAVAAQKECCRMQWAVFNWNEAAIAFYRAIGCELRSDLPQVRLAAENFGLL